MGLINRAKEFIDSQYSNPRGIIGAYFGEKLFVMAKMVRYGME